MPVQGIYIRHGSKARITVWENQSINSTCEEVVAGDLIVVQRKHRPDRRYTPTYSSKIRALRAVLKRDSSYITTAVHEPVGSVLVAIHKEED